jgi:hypothetical protein
VSNSTSTSFLSLIPLVAILCILKMPLDYLENREW